MSEHLRTNGVLFNFINNPLALNTCMATHLEKYSPIPSCRGEEDPKTDLALGHNRHPKSNKSNCKWLITFETPVTLYFSAIESYFNSTITNIACLFANSFALDFERN